MHSRLTVECTIVVDWNSTLETVALWWGKSDEPSMEQGFGLVMVSGAGLTSTLKPLPFVRVPPETLWKRRDTEYMFNVIECLLPCLLVVGTQRGGYV